MPPFPSIGLFGSRPSQTSTVNTTLQKMWSFSLLIVVLGAVGISSYENACPTDVDLSPCGCVSTLFFHVNIVECRGDHITAEELASGLQKLNQKTISKLSLRDLKLDTLPSTLFQGIDADIKNVEIFHSKIGSFSDGRPFLGLENSLEELHIDSSTVGGTINLGHLQNLQKLRLDDSDIPEINGDWFGDELRSLRDVRVSLNKPKKIGSDAFAKLSNLKTLYIKHQSLEKLERSMLPNPATALENLYLNYNQISDIAEDFLTNLPVLKKLALRQNKISTMEESVFKPILNQEIQIDLEKNPIVCNSRLNWYIPLRKSKVSKISATCYLPEELRGRKVGKLPKGKTEYDP